jgi:hypothetical protein
LCRGHPIAAEFFLCQVLYRSFTIFEIIMLFKNIILGAIAASGVSGHIVKKDETISFGCGTAEPDAEHIGMSKVLAAQEAKAGNLTARQTATVNVGVYFHVVAASTSVANGYLTVSSNHSLTRGYVPDANQMKG